MNDELALLKQTMAALEENRAVLGQDVVATTMAVLRQKLVRLAEASDVFEESRPEQRKQATMLFARISGMSRLMRLRPNTRTLGVMNMLWRFLDAAITDYGGTIDKHLTNGVMGVFGVPMAREDDPERAVRAALAMQRACVDFVSEFAGDLDLAEGEDAESVGNELELRIGINTGPVLLGEIGSAEEYTVIGSAVNVASRLEEAAVGGGIVISHETHSLVEGTFKVKSMGQVEIKGKRKPVPAFEVLGVMPRTEGDVHRGVGGIETRMVGRDGEMSVLQEIVRATAKSGQGRVITIVGEAGVGKTRLINEFQSWLMSMPAPVMVFRGQSDQRMSHLPYALIRDMFSLFFRIQDNERMMIAESKLVSGMSEYLDPETVDIHERAHAIGQLIGLNLATGFLSSVMLDEPMVARERVFDYVAEFFTAVTAAHTVTVIVLEDLHWADEGSLALIRYVSDVCRRLPLVIIGLTRSIRTSLARLLAGEEELEIQSTAVHEIIELTNLSRKDTRRLMFDILQKVPKVPDALTNLVVERAEGNPFFVEELVKILIEDGAIVPGDGEWLVKSELRDTVRIPPTLTGILQARLDRLTSLERKTLQRAAVIGRIFWDLTIAHMGDDYNDAVLEETRAALQALEQRELIFRRSISTFAGTRAYYFKHAVLRDVTYESVLLRERPLYHRRVADWLSHQSGQRVAEYAGLIAEHYELAEENISAAELYEMAAGRAEETFNPVVAIEYYRKSISLLTDEQHHIAWQLQLQERMGKLLLRQAKLLDAEQTYMAMRFMAEQDGDLNAQAHAWNGLARLHREQADYQAMLDHAVQAEHIARLVGSDLELARSYLYQSEARLRQGEADLALTAAQAALESSERLDANEEMTLSLSLLCQVYSELGESEAAVRCLNRLQDQIETLTATPRLVKMVAFSQATLGRLYNQLGDYDRASKFLMMALKQYRDLNLQTEAADALNSMGETARLRGNARAAAVLFQEALSAAIEGGDRYGRMFYRTNLGAALIDLGEYKRAETELRRVLRTAKELVRSGKWSGLSRACGFLAQSRLAQSGVKEALALAAQSLKLAQRMGETLPLAASWRVMGMTLAALSPDELPVKIDGKPTMPTDCFHQSQQLLNQAGSGDVQVNRSKAFTLWQWAAYELVQGNAERGQAMRGQAEAIAERHGFKLS